MPEVIDDEVKRLVRATCDSRGSNYIPVENFEQVYRQQTDTNLPFQKFGFQNGEAFLQSMPDACKIQTRRLKGVERRVVVLVEAENVYRPTFMKHGIKNAALKNGGQSSKTNGVKAIAHATPAMTQKSKNSVGSAVAAAAMSAHMEGGGGRIFGGGIGDASSLDLVFNPELNPHIQTTTDVPKLFPKSRGTKVEKNFVLVRFCSRGDADEALNSVFDVIGLRYSEETQARLDASAEAATTAAISATPDVSSTSTSWLSTSTNNSGPLPPRSTTNDSVPQPPPISTTNNSVLPPPPPRSTTNNPVFPPPPRSATTEQDHSPSTYLTFPSTVTNSASSSASSKDAKCLDCRQSGHKREVCPKAICSNCFEEGHLVEACPLAGYDTVTSMAMSDDFQRNFTRDARDACRSAMAHISRTDVIVNNNREEIALQPSPVTCYSCGQIGHKKVDCPNGNNTRTIQCFRCRETGHHIKDCQKESADPVDFCLNCAREGHRTHECDHVVDPRFGKTGFCKIYLGNLNSEPSEDEFKDWLRKVIGDECCLSIVVKNNKNHPQNSARYSFVKLELPLPLSDELDELWERISEAGLAEKMSLKSVGEENLVPSEAWMRTIRNQAPQWFSGPGILGPYHQHQHQHQQLQHQKQQQHQPQQPLQQQHQNGRSTPLLPSASDSSLDSHPVPVLDRLSVSDASDLPTGTDRGSSEGPSAISTVKARSSVSPPLSTSTSLPPPHSAELIVGVGRSPKWFRIDYLEKIRAELQKLGKSEKKVPRIVQAGDVPKVFFGTCTHVLDGARFWLANLQVTNGSGKGTQEFRAEEWKRFETVRDQLNEPSNFSRYRKIPAGHQGLCVFRNPKDRHILRGFVSDGEVFAIDSGLTFLAEELPELFFYPSWIRENDVEMQAVPVKLGDIRKMDPIRGASLLQQRIEGKKLYLQLYKQQDFNEAHVLSVEAIVDWKSVSGYLEESKAVQLA